MKRSASEPGLESTGDEPVMRELEASDNFCVRCAPASLPINFNKTERKRG